MLNNDMSKHFVTSFSQVGDDYGNNLNNEFQDSCFLHDIDSLYDIIHNLSDKDRLYFTLRYDIFTCKIQRTYKAVSELMCVSEETARKEVRRITQDVLTKIQQYNL